MGDYRVQLRVRSPGLKVGRGPDGRVFRTSNELRYSIGSSDDAFVCCRSPKIQPHHCWIIVNEQHGVEVQRGDAPFLVNDTLVEDRQQLAPGDVLTIGPMKLEISFQSTPEQSSASAPGDPVENQISDWLIDQDEEERERRKRDKKARLFEVEGGPNSETAAGNTQEQESSTKKAAVPPRKKPGKLPTRPAGPQSPSSDAAAEGALKQLFTRWGGEKKKKEPEKP